MGRLDGRAAVVTGASSGIGAATARALAAEGARVAVGARRVERLEALGDGFFVHELDVVDPASCERFVRAVVENLGGIDVLVNNAGLGLGRDPIWESSEEDEQRVLDTNVRALVRMTRLALPHVRDGGHVVNIGSVAGREPYENAAVYIASKYAVRGFTYAIRQDLLGRPIRVTTVDPGLVETDFSRVRFRGDEERARKVYEALTPLAPEDVADCVVFAVTRPPHVNIDEIVVKTIDQSTAVRVFRREA